MAVSAQTSDSGDVLLSLNKIADASTFNITEFGILVNNTTTAGFTGVQTVAASSQQIILVLDTLISDTDVLKLSYTGNSAKSEDDTELQVFSDLEVVNNLPHYYAVPGKIQAESYFQSEGLSLESTTDTGGGEDLGYTSTGDYADYLVAVAEDGEYKLNVRIACYNDSGVLTFLQMSESGNTLHKTDVTIPVTGGWQTWQTVTSTLKLDKGRSIIRLKITDPEFNINWFELKSTNILHAESTEFTVYPNPTSGLIKLQYGGDLKELDVNVTTLDGKLCFQKYCQNGQELDLSSLPAGVYVLSVKSGETWIVRRIILQR